MSLLVLFLSECFEGRQILVALIERFGEIVGSLTKLFLFSGFHQEWIESLEIGPRALFVYWNPSCDFEFLRALDRLIRHPQFVENGLLSLLFIDVCQLSLLATTFDGLNLEFWHNIDVSSVREGRNLARIISTLCCLSLIHI